MAEIRLEKKKRGMGWLWALLALLLLLLLVWWLWPDGGVGERVEPVATEPLRIERGTLRDSGYLAEMPGEPLDADTEEIARQQPILLVVDEGSFDIAEGAPS